MSASTRRRWAAVAASIFGMASGFAHAQTPFDPLSAAELPASASSHWVWVNDVVFHHIADGKAFLIDGDTGKMLGMLSTGFAFNGVVLPAGNAVVYSPETYFSRGTRGTRTDVVTVYDGRKLAPVAEIPVAGKRASSVPMIANAALTDDDRFLLLYNFTPAQSVSVIDTASRRFAGEVETAGCALVYPISPRAFFSLCSDGTALQVQLDAAGRLAAKARSARLFDAERDPVTEKAVRDRGTWYFVTFGGAVVPVHVSGSVPRAGESWSLLDQADRQESWRPGGIQHLALHSGMRRLYSLMHVGGAHSHKDPGTEVWVYDLDSRRRVQRLALREPATSIAVTRDAQPLLFTAYVGAPKLNVYDARSGAFLRSVAEVGFTPMTLVTY